MSENSSGTHKVTLALLLAVTIYAVVEFILSTWFHARVIHDFWPVDRSYIGPNIVATIVTYIFIALVLTLLYPPFRKMMRRIITGHKDEMKAHAEAGWKEIHDKLDAQHEEHMKALHPDVWVVGGTPLRSVKAVKKVAKKVPAKKVTKRQP